MIWHLLPPLFAKVVNTVDAKCVNDFFGLVPWYEFLKDRIDPKTCDFDPDRGGFTLLPKGGHSDVALVLAAIVDDLLRIAAVVALAYVIAGGIRYIHSQGDPEGTAAAQSTLVNALIGLAVALISVLFISFLGNRLG